MKVKWMNDKTLKTRPATRITRGPFFHDYGIIIHLPKFRRLSCKTQVHVNTQKDYVRTRLTHSLEVSQIGRELSRYLCLLISQKDLNAYRKNTKRQFNNDFEDLVAASCLAHDLGQCPFGHKGEKILHQLASQTFQSSFDANKQNIRILTAPEPFSSANITYALLDSLIKYKDRATFLDKGPGSFESEAEIVQKITRNNQTEDIRHPATYLMEAADDIAYICGDLDDFLKINHSQKIDFNQLIRILDNIGDRNWKQIIKDNLRNPEKVTSQIMKVLITHTMKGIKKSIKHTALHDYPEAMNSFLKSSENLKQKRNFLFWNDNQKVGESIAELKKYIYSSWILSQPELNEKEHLAEIVIKNLWDQLLPITTEKNYCNLPQFLLLPSDTQEKIKCVRNNDLNYSNEHRARFLCDYLSGMTDRFALEIWDRLHNPKRLRIAS